MIGHSFLHLTAIDHIITILCFVNKKANWELPLRAVIFTTEFLAQCWPFREKLELSKYVQTWSSTVCVIIVVLRWCHHGLFPYDSTQKTSTWMTFPHYSQLVRQWSHCRGDKTGVWQSIISLWIQKNCCFFLPSISTHYVFRLLQTRLNEITGLFSPLHT